MARYSGYDGSIWAGEWPNLAGVIQEWTLNHTIVTHETPYMTTTAVYGTVRMTGRQDATGTIVAIFDDSIVPSELVVGMKLTDNLELRLDGNNKFTVRSPVIPSFRIVSPIGGPVIIRANFRSNNINAVNQVWTLV